MADDILSVKSLEFHIQVKYEIEKDIIIQKIFFLPTNKRYLSYAYDTRYPLNELLEEFITRNLLTVNENVSFVDRIDSVNNIEIKYRFKKEIKWSDIKSFFATIHIYIAPFTGCSYCSRAEQKEGFIFCPERNKTIIKGIRRCPVFKQKKDLILT